MVLARASRFAAVWPLIAAGCATAPAPRAPAAPARAVAGVGASPVVPSPIVTPPDPEPLDSPASLPTEGETVALDPALLADAPPRCPPEMALILDDVCIDRWEASLVVSDAEGKPWPAFQSLDGARVPVRAVSREGVKPQGYVSGVQAEAACQASGKRLCTADEWEVACRGPRRTTYPYGNTRNKGTCNDDGRRLHPVAEVTKRLGLPPDRMWYEGMDHPLLNQLENTLRKTGERDGCTNEIGAFDMVGNLHEWIEDPEGTFRGGFYMDTRINGEGCDYATTAHSKTYHDYSTGFRCCMDADAVE